ncbi:MAG: phospholipase [Acidobacteria bacterium]|nr:phospholipase [Acidobacteriota bacterium]
MPTSPHDGQPVVHAGAPLGPDNPVVIMVHGRGAAPANILDLLPRLSRPACTYVAPAAADRAWYPFSFMADRDKNEPWLSSALTVLGRVVRDLEAHGVARSRIAVLGFSQGACLASEFVLRHGQGFGGAVIFSGGLIGPPGTTWDDARASLQDMPVFFGCSDVDAHVPKVRVEESAAVFERLGAAVTTRIYPGMGHLVSDDEIVMAQDVLDRIGRL